VRDGAADVAVRAPSGQGASGILRAGLNIPWFRQPILPTDSPLLNYVFYALPEVTGTDTYQAPVTLGPGSPSAVRFSLRELQPDKLYTVFSFWVPDFSSVPYQVQTTVAGLASSSQGAYAAPALLQLVSKAIYYLRHDLGYLGRSQLQTFAQVEGFSWANAAGQRITSVATDAPASARFSLNTNVMGTLRAEIWQSVKYSLADDLLTAQTFPITGERTDVTVPFRTDGRTDLWNYYIRVKLNGASLTTLPHMDEFTNHGAPRLVLSSSPSPQSSELPQGLSISNWAYEDLWCNDRLPFSFVVSNGGPGAVSSVRATVTGGYEDFAVNLGTVAVGDSVQVEGEIMADDRCGASDYYTLTVRASSSGGVSSSRNYNVNL
jgi:hypothetical protein